MTPTTRYTVCPGNSASQGCVVGALVVPGMIDRRRSRCRSIAPGTLLTPRVNQLDLSFSKRITVGSVKFDPKIDIFNALNSDDYFTVRVDDVHADDQPGAAPTAGTRLGRHLPAAGQHSAGPDHPHRRGGYLVGTGD